MEQQIKAMKQSPMFSVIWSLMALCSRNTTHGGGDVEGSRLFCIWLLCPANLLSRKLAWVQRSNGITRKYKNAVLKNQPFQAPWYTLLSSSFGLFFFFFFFCAETAAETFFFKTSEVYPKNWIRNDKSALSWTRKLRADSLQTFLATTHAPTNTWCSYMVFWLPLHITIC